MPRKRLVRGEAGKEARRKERQKVGRLSENVVSPNVLRRYVDRASAFAQWDQCQAWCGSPLVDERLGRYIEELWADGDPKRFGYDTICGVQHVLPHLKRHLAGSWRLMTAWEKLELPTRAPPLPLEVVQGLGGMAFAYGLEWLGLCLVLGWHCLLRTTELTSIRVGHVSFSRGNSQAILALGFTKGGKRRNANEMVSVDDRFVTAKLGKLCEGRKPEEPLWPFSQLQMRRGLNLLVELAGLSRLEFSPYSLRRGGATWQFQQTGSLDSCIVRGRWDSVRTARVYIQDGLAVHGSLRLTALEQRALRTAAKLWWRTWPV